MSDRYEPGTVSLLWTCCKMGQKEEECFMSDGAKHTGFLIAALPHSCDDWLIGGPEEIESLIHDLFAARVKLELQLVLGKKVQS